MAKLNLKEFEEQLKKSQTEIEAELKSLGEVPEMGSDIDAFDTETDEAEGYSTNLGIKKTMKDRLQEIERALDKIKNNSYGQCEKCGMGIELEVLKASPESRYCKMCKHV